MPRLLIIDDDAATARAAARVLKMRGWECQTTLSPADAVLIGFRGFDAVLADWQPGGPESVRLAAVAGVPLVVYTGAPDEVPAGLAPVEPKPYDLDSLDRKLRTAAGGGK